MIKDWVNEKHIENLDNLSEEFIRNGPFPNLSLSNFLREEKAKQLAQALSNERFYLEDHDLYQFSRTNDFKESKNKIIIEFREFLLSKEFIEFIEKLTNTKLNPQQISLHSLKLENTHYLLCHDDEVQNRKVAFILNLSENWKEEYGGQLELFESKNREPTEISKSITPDFNQFNIFLVEPGKSYHQISEVITNKISRTSVSGWYYDQ